MKKNGLGKWFFTHFLLSCNPYWLLDRAAIFWIVLDHPDHCALAGSAIAGSTEWKNLQEQNHHFGPSKWYLNPTRAVTPLKDYFKRTCSFYYHQNRAHRILENVVIVYFAKRSANNGSFFFLFTLYSLLSTNRHCIVHNFMPFFTILF